MKIMTMMAEPKANGDVGYHLNRSDDVGADLSAEWGSGGPTDGVGQGTPTIVLTIGRHAAEVAGQIVNGRHNWVSLTPPLWLLDIPVEEDVTRMISKLRLRLLHICAEVAAFRPAPHTPEGLGAGDLPPVGDHTEEQIGRNGSQSRPTNGGHILPHVWLLLSVSAVATPDQGQSYRTLVLAHAQQVTRLLDVVAWQQWRVDITPQVLLLVERGNEVALPHCQQQLSRLCAEPFYVIGCQAKAMAEEAWQLQAAQAASAVLWMPAGLSLQNSQLDNPSTGLYAVGAAQWRLSGSTIQRTLAIITAEAVVQQLLQERLAEVQNTDFAAPEGTIALPVAITLQQTFEQVIHGGEDLLHLIPTPPPIQVGRGKARAWRSALRPATILQAYCRINLHAQHLVQRKVRQQWLAAQLTTWEKAWQEFLATALLVEPFDQLVANAAVGASYGHTLTALRRTVLGRLAAIDEWLGPLGDRTVACEAVVQQHCNALEAYCATLPPRSLGGAWQMALSPQHWPKWLWQVGVGLPRQLRRLEQALTAREVATYHEANGHVVRQLGLAILHDVQTQLSAMAKLRQQLLSAATYLQAEKTKALAALPWPWDETRLARLAHDWAHQAELFAAIDPFSLADLLAVQAESAWRAPIAESLATIHGESAGEALINWLALRYQPPHAWTPADWLHATFATDADHKGRKDDLGKAGRALFTTWLADLRAKATPTWVEADEKADKKKGDRSQCRLVLPRQERTEAAAPAWDDVAATMSKAWLQRQVEDLVVIEAAVEGIWVVVCQEVA